MSEKTGPEADPGRGGDGSPQLPDLSLLRPDDPTSADALDPDAAIVEGGGYHGPRPVPPVIDTRRYQRIIAGVGLLVVIALSIFLAAHGGGTGTAGVAAGQRLHRFVAPLATSDLNDVPANTNPVCDPARPSGRGLNVCDRKPTVLALFATGEKGCVRQVDTLQSVSRRFPGVQFAAVAINADRDPVAKLVRQHDWTIPVAYDVTGAVGTLYGVNVCPIVEVVRPGGIVAQRLVGLYWLAPAHLAAAVARIAP